jgi:hypothetical protein
MGHKDGEQDLVRMAELWQNKGRGRQEVAGKPAWAGWAGAKGGGR